MNMSFDQNEIESLKALLLSKDVANIEIAVSIIWEKNLPEELLPAVIAIVLEKNETEVGVEVERYKKLGTLYLRNNLESMDKDKKDYLKTVDKQKVLKV